MNAALMLLALPCPAPTCARCGEGTPRYNVRSEIIDLDVCLDCAGDAALMPTGGLGALTITALSEQE